MLWPLLQLSLQGHRGINKKAVVLMEISVFLALIPSLRSNKYIVLSLFPQILNFFFISTEKCSLKNSITLPCGNCGSAASLSCFLSRVALLWWIKRVQHCILFISPTYLLHCIITAIPCSCPKILQLFNFGFWSITFMYIKTFMWKKKVKD